MHMIFRFAIWMTPLMISTAQGAGDPVKGESIYESRCGGCHSLDDNRVGPMHRGVYGRKAGAVATYNYSNAVKKSRIVWDDRLLDQWLTNPEKLIPGQKMGYQLSDGGERSDVIAYLRRESNKP